MKVRHKRFESVSWYFGFLSRLKFLRNIKLPTLGNTEEKMERSITISITTHSLTHSLLRYLSPPATNLSDNFSKTVSVLSFRI